MSRASEWAERYQATVAAEPRKHSDARAVVGPYIDAEVDRSGRCAIRVNGIPSAWLESERALARWIIETFGDGTVSTTP